MNATKMHALPRLRFPEFAGQWETRTLRDHGISVIDGDRGKNYPNGDDFSAKGYCLFLNAKNVTSSGFAFSDVSFISAEKDRQLSKGKLEAEDVVLTTRGTVGNIAFFGRDIPYRQMRINSGMVLLRSSDKKISPQFLYSAFFAPPLDGEVKRTAFGSAQPQLTVKGIYDLKFGAPSLPEQRKIAEFLTAVDGRIQQLGQKKALLQEYKRGVMQQLFSQTLRFKDDHGNDFPDWEEKKLGDVTKWTSGGTPAKDNPENWDGDIPWITAASMHGRYYEDSPLKITAEGLRNGSRLTAKGSILLLVRGSMLWNRIPVGIATRDVAFNQDVKALAPSDIVLATFLLQWFIASENKLLHTVVGTGIGAGKLDMEGMKSIELLLPSLPEQTKIANFLTALDRKIDSVDRQITLTQTFKRGLLQQMFV